MTKREKYKSARENIIVRSGVVAFLALLFAILSVIFGLPERETILFWEIKVQLVATIVFIIGLGYFVTWACFVFRCVYLKRTITYEVFITGETLGGASASIKIENKEPVKLQDVYIEMIRFSWNEQCWNDIKQFDVGDRFFSVGFSMDRAVLTSPVFIQVAEGIKINITRFLLDNQTNYMPLDKVGNEFSKWAKYEMVFRVTGRFIDENENVILGEYRTVLRHEQIQPHGNWAGQDVFKWEFFEKTNEKQESILKLEREKTLGFSFS